MDEQKGFNIPPFRTMQRRDFLKMAGALGISAIALEALFNHPAISHAATPGLAGYWPLDNGAGNTATDTSGSGHNGTLTNGPTWVSGKSGTALRFNGSNTSVTINTNVVDTSGSFSVAAWLSLSDLTTWRSAVSQDGANISGFFLQYTNPGVPTDGGKFAFSLVNSDSTGGTTIRAIANFQPVVNTWYHVIGVYDSTNKQSKLYVNGALQSVVTVPAAWNATGTTAIGRASGLVDRLTFGQERLTMCRSIARHLTIRMQLLSTTRLPHSHRSVLQPCL